MGSKLLSAGVAALAACWLSTAAAQQSAAPLPPDANLTQMQQQRQQTQPLNNAPLWKEIRSGVPQTTSLPGRETNVLIQSEGQTWRAARVPIATVGGVVLALVVLALIGFYAWRGTIELHSTPTGRLIERFSPVKRITHWSVAISFVVLAVSGLILTFGKTVLLPLVGYTIFAWLAVLAKNLHNFVGPVFSLVIPVMIVLFLMENIPRGYDWPWIRKFGGMLDRSGRTHVPSGKFNAGEKALFWGMVVAVSLVLIVSGYVLLFPNFDQTRQTMQTANLVHMIFALIMVAMALFHIYLGTIGMRGAYEGMRYGYVDEAWAKEHHEYWYNDVMSGKEPRSTTPAPAVIRHRVA